MSRSAPTRSALEWVARKRRRAGRLHGSLAAEALEERRLLTASTAAFALSQLEVDAAADVSSVLVRFDDDAAGQRWGERSASTPRGAAFAGLKQLALVPGLFQVELSSNQDTASTLALLSRRGDVVYAEPDYQVHIADVPNDPRFSEQWDMNNTGQTGGTFDADIDAVEAWDAPSGPGGTVVAVIDTGVDYNHPDLAPNIWVNPGEIPGNGIDDDGNNFIDDVHGYDFFNEDGDPLDDHGHGTHVAGTIGAVGNDGFGVAGVNWGVKIMALKFLGSDGSGSTSDAIEAVRYAIDNGANISNNSWGGDPYSQALYDVIDYGRTQDHIFVAAAGNGNFIGIGFDIDAAGGFYPASYDLPNIVSVAATDHNDSRAIFSNYGAVGVDLGAPGVNILSAAIGGGHVYNSGTSMAAPHVAGALSLVRDHDPSLSYSEIIDRVLASVDPVDSMQGVTATGGRLNVGLAVTPDVTGPRIVSTTPAGRSLDPVGSLRITFDEAVDASSFTLADVASLQGPTGAIVPTSLTPAPGTNFRAFDLAFATQTAEGDYSVVVGPNLTDVRGNVMDQDGDGVGGEATEDQYVGGFSIANAVARFDFGPSSSPVAAYYTGVTRSMRYDSAIGYGWDVGSVYEISRAGDDLTRDVNYTRDATFAVDLPNGEYDVIVTLGENGAGHDRQGVFLEGVQVDDVDTAANEHAVVTHRVAVSDGRLDVGLTDLGGSDPWVMLNAIDVVFIGPDVSGPSVAAIDPSGAATGPIDHVTLTFSEPIDAASFALDDIVVLEGPGGSLVPTDLTAIGPGTFEVSFPPQNAAGRLRIVVGPEVTDVAGNTMDQNGNGVGGESGDAFEAIITLAAGPSYVGRFDFGPASAPIAEGYTGLTRYDRYDAATGYGWDVGSVYELSRAGDDLTRDVNYTRDATFALDVANGEYDVVVTLGENGAAHDRQGVFLEGVQVDDVDTAANEHLAVTHRVAVSDGQLNVGLTDLGGSNPWVMINGLDVIFVGPDVSGPQVTAVAPDGAATGPVDRMTLTFSEPIDAASFTTDDVVVLEGPGGPIVPAGVNQLGPGSFEVLFAPQNDAGTLRLVVGPEITDIAGNPMDQDEDGVAGEASDDQFEAIVALAAGPSYLGKWDFGPASAPVAAGYEGLTRYDRYDAAVGYGWSIGSVYELSRAGDDLTRDVIYTKDATFAVDAPNGVYEVVVTLGENGAAHDDQGIFLEGAQVDVVDTASNEHVTVTHQVNVLDGQLDVGFKDLGGSNVWVMINALEVIYIGALLPS